MCISESDLICNRYNGTTPDKFYESKSGAYCFFEVGVRSVFLLNTLLMLLYPEIILVLVAKLDK